GVNYAGIQRSAQVNRVIVTVVVIVLVAVVVICLASGQVRGAHLDIGADASAHGVLQAAGLLFFAFAGYARVATLGEEVREPSHTIPRAISSALAITLAIYAFVAVAALAVLGPARLAASSAPLVDAVKAAGAGDWAPVIRIAAAISALGALMAL